MRTLLFIATLLSVTSCGEEEPVIQKEVTAKESPAKATEESKTEKTVSLPETVPAAEVEVISAITESRAFKLTSGDCVDPDLTKVLKEVRLMLCDGTIAEGSYTPTEPPDLTGLIPANLKSGVSVNGVVGTYDSRPADCGSNGQVGCVATASYQAADLQLLTASNLKSGVVVAGVTGTYDNRPADCSGSSQVGCVATSTWKSADLTNLSATNVKDGGVLAGVTGTYNNRPADCSANGQVGCVSTASYKAADLTNLSAGNIKKGVTVAGLAGDFPSATHKLTGADTTADLTSATFDAKVKSAIDFEWFDAEGARYTYQGDADLATASNVKDGVTIFGQTGTLAAAVDPSAWDVRKGTVVGATTGLANMKCRQRSGLAPLADKCYGESYVDVTSSGQTCTSSPSTCRYQDRISGLFIARSAGSKTWSNANTYCSSLVVDGVSGWRLPEREELHRMFIQGISSTTGLMVDGAIGYWSLTAGTTGRYLVRVMDTAVTVDTAETSSTGTVCVK